MIEVEIYGTLGDISGKMTLYFPLDTAPEDIKSKVNSGLPSGFRRTMLTKRARRCQWYSDFLHTRDAITLG